MTARFDSGLLAEARSSLIEYYDFRRMARHRRKLEEQLRNANIPLTNVPWKTMVRRLYCQDMFSDIELTQMTTNTPECCTSVDIDASQHVINFLLENDEDDEVDLTETWFEINELKQRIQRAMNILPPSRRARKEMLYKILGYPTGYTESEEDFNFGLNQNDDMSVDLTRVLTIDEQQQMHTGDLIEFSGNRLHDAFYVYRLPQKGIWSQIKQMWLKHQVTDFIFNDTESNSIEEEQEEIILVPAMDEYGYGVPYLFSTRPTELLPEGALQKYVDINCPLVAKHTENPTIKLVQKHLNERLKNPNYVDKYMGDEMSVKLDRFPQEYVAMVHINDAPKDNVLWVQRIHYNRHEIARDLNDNQDIFFSRRILEAEEQYRQKQNSSI